jgi:hypothetical protein
VPDTAARIPENGGQNVVVFASFATVGLILAWHRPGNPIGWIILAVGDLQGLAIDAFAARLQDSVDLAAVQADLASVVHRALEPAHVTLWMNNRS